MKEKHMQNRYFQNRKTKLPRASIRKHLVCESASVNLICFLKLMVWSFYRILEIHTLSSPWKGAVWVPNKDACLGHLHQKEVTSLERKPDDVNSWRPGGERGTAVGNSQDTGSSPAWLLPPLEDKRLLNTPAINQEGHPHRGRRLEPSRYFTSKKL